jgi:hypothetical protein
MMSVLLTEDEGDVEYASFRRVNCEIFNLAIGC